MGYWWKDVPTIPEDFGLGTVIKRDPNAWSKKKAPGLWRLQHQWVIINVYHSTPFELYFDDGERKMRFRKPIKENCFAARVGPRDTKFVAIDSGGILVETKPMDFRRWSRSELWTMSDQELAYRSFRYQYIGPIKLV